MVRLVGFVSGVLACAAFLGALDVIHALTRMPEVPTLFVASLAWVVSTGGLASAALPPLVVQRIAWEKLPARLRPALGALDGLVLGSMALVLENTPSVRTDHSLALTVVATLAGGVAAFVAAKLPRVSRAVALVAGSILLVWLETLLVLGKEWLRFSIDLFLLGACGAAWEGFRLRTPSLRAALFVVASFVLAAPVGVRAFPPLRGVVFEYGSHARALLTWASSFAFGEERLGTVACSGARPPEPAFERSALSGAAEGADVLFVSFDAMRWDHADSIPEVWSELGPHATFSRAVSPAPRTEHAFAALLRGVPSRFARKASTTSAHPSVADVLRKAGYRAVQVPTHHYFGKNYWANDGFELVVPPGFGARIVPADSALKKGLEVARSTKEPLFLWIHLMEGHEPYRWRGGRGPPTSEGQRHAFRDLAAPAAAFVREFKKSRAGRKLVLAVFGDHGEEFGEHGSAYHSGTAYAEQVRSAFGLAAPGIAAVKLDAPVSLASLPATVVDLLGLPPVPSFIEPSLLPCVGTRARCPTLAVSQLMMFENWIGYTFERHRLVVDPEYGIERLFDSTSDPLEQHDLAPEKPALLATLRQRARDFDREHCLPEASR